MISVGYIVPNEKCYWNFLNLIVWVFVILHLATLRYKELVLWLNKNTISLFISGLSPVFPMKSNIRYYLLTSSMSHSWRICFQLPSDGVVIIESDFNWKSLIFQWWNQLWCCRRCWAAETKTGQTLQPCDVWCVRFSN